MNNKSTSSKNFLNGASILMVALAITKVIGFIYKIPLTRILEGAGNGYYNEAYQIYSFLFVISTGGLPIAIAKMISESNAVGRIKEPRKILSLALKTFAIIGAIGMLIMIFCAKWFALSIFKTEQSALGMITVAPAIFFVSLGSAFKGFFQGYKNMVPTALYQIIEAGTKLLGFIFIFILIALGYANRPEVLASGAIFGVTLGSFTSMSFMFFRFYFGKEKIEVPSENPIESRSNGALFKAMLSIAIPITISSSIMSLTNTIDTMLLKNSLIVSGLDAQTAHFHYGSYTMLYSLFNLPPTLTQTIGISVLPFISSLFATGKKKEAYENMDSSMRIVSLIAAPCAVGMSLFSRPILTLIYGGLDKEIDIAAPAFTILALGIYLVAMAYPLNIFLQAIGKARVPMYSMIVGAVLKITTNVLLVSNPNIRTNGAPFGTLACYGAVLVINMIMLYKYQRYKPHFVSVFVKPILAAVISVGLAAIGYGFTGGGGIMTLLFIGVAALLYLILIFVLKAINRYDVLLLPKGEKLCDILTRKGLIK